jgi:hypothetical protein
VNPQLIGGEMTAWSDLDATLGPGPVRGAVLEPLLATASGRILIAGPHDPALIDAAPAGDLTLLVRGIADADALAARYADRPDITVYCGGLDKLDATSAYDTIIALAGLARLSSAESAQPTWGEALQLLTAALRPGGRLLLSVENFFGVHRLVALPAETTDADWVVDSEYDPSRPAGLARVRAHLTGAGLDTSTTYAAYPQACTPTVLLREDVLADGELTGFLQATLAGAAADAPSTLTDPGRLAADAVRHGLAADLAPAWILLACLAPGTSGPALPEALICTDSGRITGIDGAPRGRTLEDLLIAAALRRDLPSLRDLLAAWQNDAAAGVAADQVIVTPDGGLIPLAMGGRPVEALHRFATAVLRRGLPHPWPAPTGSADLTLAVAAMAGLDLAAADIPAGQPGDFDATSVRELVVERDRLAAQVAAAAEKAAWYERMLTDRDTKLQHALGIIDLLSASGPARAGKALIGGVRAARRSARSAVRGLVNPRA